MTESEADAPDTTEPLRQRLERLERKEAQLEQRVRAVQQRYRDELGPLVEELLTLRRDRLEQKAYAHRRSARLRNAFHDAQAKLERFREMMGASTPGEATPDRDDTTARAGAQASLTDAEQDALKAAFRAASKECHPDVVDPADREQATKVFHALREAYQAGNLRRVTEIAEQVGATVPPRSPKAPASASEGAQPNAEAAPSAAGADPAGAPRAGPLQTVQALRERIRAVEASIEALRDTDAYAATQAEEGLDRYFERRRQGLRQQIRRLRRTPR
jgi:hypothetical protein